MTTIARPWTEAITNPRPYDVPHSRATCLFDVTVRLFWHEDSGFTSEPRVRPIDLKVCVYKFKRRNNGFGYKVENITGELPYGSLYRYSIAGIVRGLRDLIQAKVEEAIGAPVHTIGLERVRELTLEGD